MCWTRAKELGEPKKQYADDDIIVYKIVSNFDKSICSYFVFFMYEPNKVYAQDYDVTPVSRKEWEDYTIEAGFHSYDGKCEVGVFRHRTDSLIVHSSPDAEDSEGCQYCQQEILGIITAAECVIPKGSAYYKNERDEIVSDKIKMTGRTISINAIRDMILDESKTDASMSFTQLFDKLDK